MRSLILTVSLLASPMVAEGETKPPSPTEEYLDLVRRWNQALKDYAQAEQAADTPEAKKKVFATFPKPIFQDRFMELVRKYPKDAVSIEAIAWVFRNPWHGPKTEANVAEAIALLARHHLKSEHLGGALLGLAYPLSTGKSAGGLNEQAEQLLRSALGENPHRKVQGQACYSLANYLGFHARHRSAGMSKQEAEKMAKESETLFERVTGRYADIEAPYRGTLGVVAEAELFELRRLVIGKVVPEIKGEDIHGQEFKLSDYRGKVVVLTFSGNWCGPCRAMYPREREIVARLRDKPFALVSVNTDEGKETLRKSIESGEITWRCWWDGGIDGPITTAWGVESFPAVYILDAKGIIRSKGASVDEMEQSIEALLKEGPADRPPLR